MPAVSRHYSLYILFTLVLALHIGAWGQLRDARARWINVPPAPSEAGAALFALGDAQLAYRGIGVMLQNLGDTGGMSSAFARYDYDELAHWFMLADTLDSHANFVPFLAAFYFGAAQTPDKLEPLTLYLHKIGSRTEGEKWRWLAHAIYLRRFKMNDLDTAYQWAQELATMDKPDMPYWTKQMPAFILNAQGDKRAAYDILVQMLKSGKGKMPREEVNAITAYICDQILDATQAANDSLCQSRE